jgi:PAS domain S-box-containing protein
VTALSETDEHALAVGRILIVDDNAELAGSLRDVLLAARTDADAPLHVTVAARGSEALERAAQERFDVALVDVKLPDGSGVDLIAPLKLAAPGSEVVLITGFGSVDAALAAMRSGAYAMILKSFRPEELVTTVRQALGKVRLQREREELERRYRAVVELTDVLVVAVDLEGRVALFNRKAAETARVPAEEALGADFVETFLSEPDRTRAREMLSLAVSADRIPPRDSEVGFLVRGGAPRRVRFHLSAAREGEVTLVYGIGIDITERRALEKRAADAEAISAMGTLALNLAHEIRNPLNAAKLQLMLLGRDVGKLPVAPEAKVALDRRAGIVGDEIERLNRLLTEFLELARPRGIARAPVALAQLVDGVLSLERAAAESRGIRIEVDVPAELAMVGDVEKLKQVVLNLVVNAIEAMKDGGRLALRGRSAGEVVELEIADSGPGIPPELLAQVFDPFFTTKEAGTGLGLSIVRKIVDQHGGDVRIDSERGKGTRAVVTVPRAR